MTPNPRTTNRTKLAADALRHMTGDGPKIMQLFVVEDGKPVGIVHLHDFLRAGLM